MDERVLREKEEEARRSEEGALEKSTFYLLPISQPATPACGGKMKGPALRFGLRFTHQQAVAQ